MYNKLFTKILDSSIWLEPTPTRIVWITLLAAMDEDGFCAFAAPANLARRAVVSDEECSAALAILEAPDENSADPDHEGRRIERIPGGWYVLNAPKYREVVSREESKRLNRERQRRHYQKRKQVADPNAHLTAPNVHLTQSEAYTEAEAKTERAKSIRPAPPSTPNPHHKATNLIDGRDLRTHGQHAWCSWPLRDGFCVWPSWHSRFIGQVGRPTADAELKAFYPATMAKYTGLSIGDLPKDFWENEVAHWLGTVTSKPSTRALTPLQEMTRRRKAEVGS